MMQGKQEVKKHRAIDSFANDNFEYPKPVCNIEDLQNWFAKVPNSKSLIQTTKELAKALTLRLTNFYNVIEWVEKVKLPSMISAVDSFDDDQTFSPTMRTQIGQSELALKYAAELYAILAFLQDWADYLWTGDKGCLLSSPFVIDIMEYVEDEEFSLPNSNRVMSKLSCAYLQGMANGLLNNKQMTKNVRRRFNICFCIKVFFNSIYFMYLL